MIPCNICGRNAENNWVVGYPPAPDSQKMGLCPMHDTDGNRRQAVEDWQAFMSVSFESWKRDKAESGKTRPQLLSIYFTGGASVSLPCTKASSDPLILKAITPTGESLFFPMSQIRLYSLSPYWDRKEE